MSTDTLTQKDTYEITGTDGAFCVLRNGEFLTDRGVIRVYKTRNAARKRISRERSGNYHR